MPDLTKIATCCYCGQRTVLQLRNLPRRELSCGSCGAALHNLKPLPVTPKTRILHEKRPHPVSGYSQRKRKKHRQKAKFNPLRHLVHELFDELEDFFD